MLRYLKIPVLAVLAVGLAGLLLACGPTPEPLPFPTPERGEVAVVPPPTPTTPVEPTQPPAIIAPDDGCESCHYDEEKLKATAEEEVETESLSEGEG